MMVKNEGGSEIFDDPDWIDGCSVLMKIDASVDSYQKEYSRLAAVYTFEEYSGRYRNKKNPFTETSQIAERMFLTLVEDDEDAPYDSDFFGYNQVEAAYSGFLVGLRIGKIACNRNQSIYMGLVRMKMNNLLENPLPFPNSQDTLASQSSNFVAKYLIKTPPRDYMTRKPPERSFAQTYAYQLGFLMTISTAFELLIDPDTYYGLVEGYTDRAEYPNRKTIIDLLDIAVLPTAE